MKSSFLPCNDLVESCLLVWFFLSARVPRSRLLCDYDWTRCLMKRTNALLQHRSSGSPAKPNTEPSSPYWDAAPERAPKPLPKSQNVHDLTQTIAEQELEIELLRDEVHQLKERIKAMERKESLRTSGSEKLPSSTPHYIPRLYEATHGERNGRPLTLETLREVASICCTGQQYEKYQSQCFLSNRIPIPSETFYRNSKHIWETALKLFERTRDKLLNTLLNSDDPITLCFDASWHKRYGFNSALGRFCVIEFNSGDILYGGVFNLGRTGKDSNYDGSSKGMESAGLSDFLKLG